MKLAILSTLLASAAALKINSPAGQKLMSKARSLEEAQNSWIVNYSLVFASCHSVVNFNSEGGNDEEGAVTVQNLVKYKLCPSNKCSSGCSGAEYLVDMDQFVNSYTEWQMNDQEYKCEQARETCGCDDRDDDNEEQCEINCYKNAGLYDTCVEQEQGDDDNYVFELQEWLECKEMDYEGKTYYNAYGEEIRYYVGPTCSSNGHRINLGVFTDEMCTVPHSDSSIFKSTYGVSLPYQNSNIVSQNCISCKVEDANNNGYYNDPEITEICEESYDMSAKCESKLANKITYPVTRDCSYINSIASHEVGASGSSSGGAAVGFAVFFGLTSAALAGVAGKLYMDTKSRKIELNSDAAVV